MVKDIKIYSRPTCAPCRMLKAWLAHKGLAYHDVNVDEDPAAFEEAYKLSGFTMVPVTVVTKTDGTQRVIAGYNISQLAAIV